MNITTGVSSAKNALFVSIHAVSAKYTRLWRHKNKLTLSENSTIHLYDFSAIFITQSIERDTHTHRKLIVNMCTKYSIFYLRVGKKILRN